MSIYVRCPFCDETDFDLIGLKDHLLNRCDDFKNTEAGGASFSVSYNVKDEDHPNA